MDNPTGRSVSPPKRPKRVKSKNPLSGLHCKTLPPVITSPPPPLAGGAFCRQTSLGGTPPPLPLWPSSFAGARRSPPAPSAPRPPLRPPPPPRTASPPRDPSRALGSSLRRGSFSSTAGEASRRGRNRVSCAPAPSSGHLLYILGCCV